MWVAAVLLARHTELCSTSNVPDTYVEPAFVAKSSANHHSKDNHGRNTVFSPAAGGSWTRRGFYTHAEWQSPTHCVRSSAPVTSTGASSRATSGARCWRHPSLREAHVPHLGRGRFKVLFWRRNARCHRFVIYSCHGNIHLRHTNCCGDTE